MLLWRPHSFTWASAVPPALTLPAMSAEYLLSRPQFQQPEQRVYVRWRKEVVPGLHRYVLTDRDETPYCPCAHGVSPGGLPMPREPCTLACFKCAFSPDFLTSHPAGPQWTLSPSHLTSWTIAGCIMVSFTQVWLRLSVSGSRMSQHSPMFLSLSTFFSFEVNEVTVPICLVYGVA